LIRWRVLSAFSFITAETPSESLAAWPRGQPITSLFDEAFRDVGDALGMASVKANLLVNTWQGAIVVARAGEGLEHIGRVFRYLKEIVPLSW
jgi:hypothetical protein